jgi:integrase
MSDDAKVYLTERKPGVFMVRTYLGTDGAGKPLFKHETFRGTKNEARARVHDLEAAILRGAAPGLSGETFGGFCDKHIEKEERDERLEPSTLKGYREARARITAKLAVMPLEELHASDLEEWLGSLLKKGLSPTTVKNSHAFARLVLSRAVDLELIPGNPAKRVKPPKPKNKRRREVSFDDFEDSVEATTDEKIATIERDVVLKVVASFEAKIEGRPWMKPSPCLAAAIFTAYATGLRRGELVGLSWKDVDLDRGTLKIARAVWWPYGNENPIIKTTKGGDSREIMLSLENVARLKTWRVKLAELALSKGKRAPSILFPDPATLGVMRPDLLSNKFRTRIKALDLGGNKSFHALRHTHASELLERGEPVRNVSERLGHKDVATTLRVYAHALPGSDPGFQSRLDALLRGPSPLDD